MPIEIKKRGKTDPKRASTLCWSIISAVIEFHSRMVLALTQLRLAQTEGKAAFKYGNEREKVTITLVEN